MKERYIQVQEMFEQKNAWLNPTKDLAGNYCSMITDQYWKAFQQGFEFASEMPAATKIGDCLYIDLNKCMWESICEAAKESKWIPPEYYTNDWVADVCDFLKNGVKQDINDE